jgi:hypothetical protein
VSVELTVEKDIAVQVHGYLSARRRLADAIAAGEGDVVANDVYSALVETCEWVATLAKRSRLMGDADADAVTFARDRHHHHAASTAQFVNGRWEWRPAAVLPLDPKHPGVARRRCYEQQLEQKPLLEVFGRLEPKIRCL